MKPFKLFVVLAIGTLMSACATSDTATRNAMYNPDAPKMMLRAGPEAAPQPVAFPNLQIEKFTVAVPEQLKVSEANRYYPHGDIVWRGDPVGDRHAQVKAIFEAALMQSAGSVQGGIPTLVEIEVLRFHALTEKARYTTGGVHSITFMLSLRDTRTGLLLAPPHEVRADLDGFGGQEAIDADRRGQTQKVRITGHLANVVRQELERPGSHINAKLGMFQALNKL
jgi:hypothetical protein